MPSRNTNRRSILQGLAVAALSPALIAWRSNEALFAPSASAIDFYAESGQGSGPRPDFTPWSEWLKAEVIEGEQGVNLIDYGGVSAAQRSALDGIIREWAGQSPRAWDTANQRAYWINLYNALTLKVVLDHYPVASIRDIDISPGFFSSGPWDAELLEIEGRAVTLNDIEHGILRPLWGDPRIHYAVNCASIGCPNLRSEAYLPARLEAQLEEQADAYVNDPRGLSFTAEGPVVSRIYDWFIEDFGGEEVGVIAHLRRHAAPERAQRLAAAGGLAGTAYDWSLNDAGAE